VAQSLENYADLIRATGRSNDAVYVEAYIWTKHAEANLVN
jgi:hypothetical protein